MIISLDGIVKEYIKIAQNITNNTGQEVKIVIRDQPVAEIFIDVDEDGEFAPFTKYFRLASMQ